MQFYSIQFSYIDRLVEQPTKLLYRLNTNHFAQIRRSNYRADIRRYYVTAEGCTRKGFYPLPQHFLHTKAYLPKIKNMISTVFNFLFTQLYR